jgi:hypothetical protein
MKGKLRLRSKFKLCKIMVIPAAIRGSETWSVEKNQDNRIQTAEVKFIREVAGCKRKDHRHKRDIRKKYKV